MITWEYEMRDPEGLHARPASKIVVNAMKYKSSICILCRQNRADAKNILELMALGVRRNDRILVEASGEDEEEALETIKRTLVEYDDLNL